MKRYIIASLLYIAFIGWYISTFVSPDGTTSVSALGIVLPSLSNSVWVMLILLVFAVGSVSHMVFYSVVESLHLRKSEKDYEKMVESISEAYLGKQERRHFFKTPSFRTLGYLVDNSVLFPGNIKSTEVTNEKISETVKAIEDIKAGKVVDVKKLGLAIDNPLTIQNERNRFKDGSQKAKDFLSNPNKYDTELLKEIYTEYVKTTKVKNIEAFKDFVTKEALVNILARVNAEEDTIEISNDTLVELFNKLELSKDDYLEIASSMSCCMLPEQRMRLFEILSDQHEEAMDSYLYTLFDLEMLEPAAEILDISQQDEFLNFKAYRILKESNNHFNINLFV